MRKEILSEALGTALLLYVIVGSGIVADSIGNGPGPPLFVHAVAVGLGLGAVIAMLQTVSGSHFNPAVSVAFWRSHDLSRSDATRYIAAQIGGSIAGVIAANLSFGRQMLAMSTTIRSGAGLVLAEGISTFVLVLLIMGLVRTDRARAIPMAVGAWVAAAVVATSSTGFANPAVTLARAFTDSYTGIALTSVPTFLAAELLGGLLASFVAIRFLFRQQDQPAHT